MNFRNEWKHEISTADLLAIRQRLQAVAKYDTHAVNGKYEVRSLYFDNLADEALLEKINGVNKREKFRIRYYNGDTSVIHLEKKSKWNGFNSKEIVDISREEAQSVLDGKLDWMMGSKRVLVEELYCKMMSIGLRPRTIVDYTRIPFVYAPGNVRVTLDYNIRTGLGCTDFLNRECVTVPAGDTTVILEVKWDSFLPSIIRDAIQLKGRRSSAFSKYAACRIYG